MIKTLRYIYRWLNKSDLKEFKKEQETENKIINHKLDMLIDIVVYGNHNPRKR